MRLLKHCKPQVKSVQTPVSDKEMTVVIPPSRGRIYSRSLSPSGILPSISDPSFAVDPADGDVAVYKDVVLVSDTELI